MLNFRKTTDLKRMFENMVGTDTIIASVFKDNPELEHFEFSCRSEYDDNNYSDVTDLTKVNGHRVDYDGRYSDDSDYAGDEEADDNESDLPRLNQAVVHAIMEVVSTIASQFGHDDHIIRRSNFSNRTRNSLSKEEQRYLKSYITKEEIEEDWFLSRPAKWAAYYAQDHGKFSKEAETKIFCVETHMEYAFMYAQALKRPLPKHIENYFTTKNLVDPHEDDDRWFKEYLKWKQNLEKVKSK